jgi:hypothetical protein
LEERGGCHDRSGALKKRRSEAKWKEVSLKAGCAAAAPCSGRQTDLLGGAEILETEKLLSYFSQSSRSRRRRVSACLSPPPSSSPAPCPSFSAATSRYRINQTRNSSSMCTLPTSPCCNSI